MHYSPPQPPHPQPPTKKKPLPSAETQEATPLHSPRASAAGASKTTALQVVGATSSSLLWSSSSSKSPWPWGMEVLLLPQLVFGYEPLWCVYVYVCVCVCVCGSEGVCVGEVVDWY